MILSTGGGGGNCMCLSDQKGEIGCWPIALHFYHVTLNKKASPPWC